MAAAMMMPPYTADAQFIIFVVTGVLIGKRSKDVGDDDVAPGAQVKDDAVAAGEPAAGEQGLVAETLVEDAGHAYEICDVS